MGTKGFLKTIRQIYQNLSRIESDMLELIVVNTSDKF